MYYRDMADIEEKISALSPEQTIQFRRHLMDNLYDRIWCNMHEIDYVDPDINKAKEESYKEMFEKNKND